MTPPHRETLMLRVLVGPADERGVYRAQVFQGGLVAEAWADSGMSAAVRAVADVTALWRLREPTALRGPDALVLARPDDGWPLSNLRRGGCKHDVTSEDAESFRAGRAVRCAKCEALLVPIVERDPTGGGYGVAPP